MASAQPESGPQAEPIAIPTTKAKLGSPFLRAYPTVLAQYGLPRESFLTFLDDLNRVAVVNPPVQILGLTGQVLSFVPLQTAQIAGSAVKTAADLATYGISKGLTELCLREANREIFEPRGLKVGITKLDALAKIAGMPVLNARGQLDKTAQLLAPLEDLSEVESLSAQERRLRALEAWIEPLDLALLPEIKVPSDTLGRISAAMSERQRQKEAKGLMKDRRKELKDYDNDSRKAQEDFDKDMRKLKREEDKIRMKNLGDSHKLERKLEKVEKEKEKARIDFEKEIRKVEKTRFKDDKEEKGMKRVLWLVIWNIDDSSSPRHEST
ncbi:hypothetical protein NKR23_g7864 [Pleurostoma richardsiae]|uniref:Uncharacterized protein n=1 Tax=Pleurostoma richardsiae TaxID=41990 RepID=A0AA38VM41_9PEZI|nr:hypothetical protein NKR23_g7864 [Pleurostoma richardsiae]